MSNNIENVYEYNALLYANELTVINFTEYPSTPEEKDQKKELFDFLIDLSSQLRGGPMKDAAAYFNHFAIKYLDKDVRVPPEDRLDIVAQLRSVEKKNDGKFGRRWTREEVSAFEIKSRAVNPIPRLDAI